MVMEKLDDMFWRVEALRFRVVMAVPRLSFVNKPLVTEIIKLLRLKHCKTKQIIRLFYLLKNSARLPQPNHQYRLSVELQAIFSKKTPTCTCEKAGFECWFFNFHLNS